MDEEQKEGYPFCLRYSFRIPLLHTGYLFICLLYVVIGKLLGRRLFL